MPTYEYHCDSCDQNFDYFQSMNDERLETCILEGCEGKVKRLLGTGAGIIFKGSGFYQTDYRSESYKKGQSADSSGADDKGGAKSDSSKAEGTKSASNDSKSNSSSPAPKTAPKASPKD